MATVHGKGGAFWLDDSGTTLRDLSTNVSDFTITFPNALAEDSALGDSAVSRVRGLNDVSIALNGQYDSASNLSDAVLGGSITKATSSTFKAYPAGKSTGKIVYYGECFVESYEIGVPVGDVVTFSATLRGASGSGVTRSTCA